MSKPHFAAGVLVGVVATLSAVWLTVPPDEADDPPAPAASSTPVTERSPRSAPPASLRQPTTPERDLEAELELARETIRELERDLHGDPIPWDDALPATHQPAFVSENIDRALRECDVPARLVDVDCDEVPCYAVLETEGPPNPLSEGPNWYQMLVDCPVWKEPWGGAVRLVTDEVHCPDGSTRSFAMISPWVAIGEGEAETSADEPRAVRENVSKRTTARAANARSSLCF